MGVRRGIWIGIAIGHLLMVGLGAGKVDVSGLQFAGMSFLGPVLDYYGELTGSGSSYGFFAPGIFGQLRARLSLIDDDGRESSISLEPGSNHEADLRVGNIIDQFESDIAEESEDFQRSMAASLAGTVFGRHPEAKEVVVRLDEYSPVSMEEYRRGQIAKWDPIYEAKFLYRKSKDEE